MCNGLYLGAPEGAPRPSPWWESPAIVPDPAVTINVGGMDNVNLDPVTHSVSVQVTVKNQATYDIPGILDLYWSDPTTGFLADASRLIEEQFPFMAGRPSTSTIDTSLVSNFIWDTAHPDSGGHLPQDVNGGHVCLLARISHNPAPIPGGGNCGGGYPDDGSPSTDFRSAVHNVILVPPSPLSKKVLKFAFAAANPLPKPVGTRLLVRPLIPERNEKELKRLLTPERNYAFAAQGSRFGTVAQAGIAIGTERVLARPSQRTLPAVVHKCVIRRPPALLNVPRLGYTGVISQEIDEMLRGPDQKPEESKNLDLIGYEIRQAIVSVEPGEGADLFAFEVIHETTEAKPRVLGGLTFIYRLRRRLF